MSDCVDIGNNCNNFVSHNTPACTLTSMHEDGSNCNVRVSQGSAEIRLRLGIKSENMNVQNSLGNLTVKQF